MQLPDWREAPKSLLQMDGHCGLLTAWIVLRHFGRRASADSLVRACRYTKKNGIFTIGLAYGLKMHGLQVSFHTDHDPQIGGYERRCYSQAANIGIHPLPPLEIPAILRALKRGAVPIVLFNTESDLGHFSPMLGLHGNQLDLPMADGERMSKDEFLVRWSAPGICKQCLITNA